MAHTGQHEDGYTARGEAPAGAAAVAAAVDAAEAVLDPLADRHLDDRAPLSTTGCKGAERHSKYPGRRPKGSSDPPHEPPSLTP